MRLLVLAAALPRIVAFATLPDERMSYSSTGCPPGLLACEEGITFATSEDMLRNVHNAADHPEIDASLQLAKRCVPFGMYAKWIGKGNRTSDGYERRRGHSPTTLSATVSADRESLIFTLSIACNLTKTV